MDTSCDAFYTSNHFFLYTIFHIQVLWYTKNTHTQNRLSNKVILTGANGNIGNTRPLWRLGSGVWVSLHR
jgi:hypothetical protein